jgi:hypothetical protein
MTMPMATDQTPSVVQAWPENHWRQVWHLHCPKRGPMKRQPETMTIEDGSVLDRYECLGCGATCFAGLDKSWRIINRPVPLEPVRV